MAEERAEAQVLPLRPRGDAPELLVRDGMGRVLRRIRQEQGRTLDEVSTRARVSMPYLSEIERGRKEASSEVLSALCGALAIRPSHLMILTGRELAGRGIGGRGLGETSALGQVAHGPADVTMMAA